MTTVTTPLNNLRTDTTVMTLDEHETKRNGQKNIRLTYTKLDVRRKILLYR